MYRVCRPPLCLWAWTRHISILTKSLVFSDDTTRISSREKVGGKWVLSWGSRSGRRQQVWLGRLRSKTFNTFSHPTDDAPIHCLWEENKCKITWIEVIKGLQLPSLADIVFVFSSSIPEAARQGSIPIKTSPHSGGQL